MMLEKIWSEYQSGLRNFLRSKISNESDAEDVLQEILIKTYQNLDKLQNPDSIKSWLFQIANRSVIDFYRANGKASLAEGETLWHESSEEDAKQQLASCIQPLMSSLSDSSAELLQSIDIEGKSQKEVAEELGVSYSTLKSRVQKSRTELKTVYEQCCRFSFDSQGAVMDYEAKQSKCNKC